MLYNRWLEALSRGPDQGIRLLLAAVFLGLASLPIATCSADAPQGVIRGHLTEVGGASLNPRPLAGRQVLLLKSDGIAVVASATTAWDGAFSFEVQPGSYLLQYKQTRRLVRAEPNSNRDWNLQVGRK